MENEKRLIDANFTKAAIQNYIANNEVTEAFVEIAGHICGMLDDCETVDAVEVVHGRWDQVQRWATKAKYRCSVCGREIMSAVKVNIEKYPYCHCGAKMDGGNEDV